MNKRSAIAVACIAIAAPLSSIDTVLASTADRDTYNYGLPVQICHSRQPQPSNGQGTGAHNNPYGTGRIVVTVSAIVDHGHEIHNGPVFNGTNQPHWGDIIPPFEYGDGKEFSLNWTDEGKDIFFNDCQPKDSSPSGAPTSPTTPNVPGSSGHILSTNTVTSLPATGGMSSLIGVLVSTTTAALLYGYRLLRDDMRS